MRRVSLCYTPEAAKKRGNNARPVVSVIEVKRAGEYVGDRSLFAWEKCAGEDGSFRAWFAYGEVRARAEVVEKHNSEKMIPVPHFSQEVSFCFTRDQRTKRV